MTWWQQVLNISVANILEQNICIMSLLIQCIGNTYVKNLLTSNRAIVFFSMHDVCLKARIKKTIRVDKDMAVYRMST